MATSNLLPGSHTFKGDGVQFHYLVRGTGPIAVFQGLGWGLSGAYLWNSLGKHLEDKRTMVYLEPRGNGDSGDPEDATTMTAKTMVDDLELLRGHLGLETLPMLLGHSHGGAIALGYAEKYPERVSKLVLLAPQIMDAPSGHMKRWMEMRKDNPDYAPCIAKMSKVFAAGGSGSDEEFLEDLDVMLEWHFTDAKLTENLRRDIRGVSRPAAAASFKTNKNDAQAANIIPHLAQASQVQADTFILWGSEDPASNVEDGKVLAENIPNARIVVVPGAAHFPWYDKPEPYIKALRSFL